MDGARFVVEDVNAAVADLQDIDVASDRGIGCDRNVKAQVVREVMNVLRDQIHRDFHRHGDRIRGEHEALELVMPTLVVGDGLERKVRNAWRKVLLLHDLDAGEVEGNGGL
jgi:hypothetical protein